MKTIVFVRHASAEEKKDQVPDISRSLVREGVREAKNVAKRISGEVQGDSPSLLLISSPANRALETAHIFARKFGYPAPQILIKEPLFNAPSSESILTLIREIEENYDTVLLFGHNPSLSEGASFLSKEFVFDIPKSSFVSLVFEKNSWNEIDAHTGLLKFLGYPKEKSKKIDEFEKVLSSKLARHISDWLEGISFQHDQKPIEKHASKIVKNLLKDLSRKVNGRKKAH